MPRRGTTTLPIGQSVALADGSGHDDHVPDVPLTRRVWGTSDGISLPAIWVLGLGS
jgi:hypothetical protein